MFLCENNSSIVKVPVNDSQNTIEFFTKEVVETSLKTYGARRHASESYKQRAVIADNPVARRLFEIMDAKQTNLCLSADVENSADLIDLIKLIGK